MLSLQSSGEPEPQRARIVVTVRGREARSPVKNHLLGVFNDSNEFIIKRGNEVVIVEVPKP